MAMAQQHATAMGAGSQPINQDTRLHRHLLQEWIQPDGRPSSQAFKLSQSDIRMARDTGTTPGVSAEHGDMITAQEAHKRRRQQGKRSDGVATVTGGDCRQLDLQPVHDALDTPEHVSLLFPAGLTNRQNNRIGRRLAELAIITVPVHEHL